MITPLIIELKERQETFWELRKSKLEIETSLATIKVLKIDVLTLEKLVILEFMELVSKKVVVLCQEGLMRFDLGIQIPKPLNQGFFFENLNPSSRKRRRMKAMNTSDSLGKGENY